MVVQHGPRGVSGTTTGAPRATHSAPGALYARRRGATAGGGGEIVSTILLLVRRGAGRELGILDANVGHRAGPFPGALALASGTYSRCYRSLLRVG